MIISVNPISNLYLKKKYHSANGRFCRHVLFIDYSAKTRIMLNALSGAIDVIDASVNDYIAERENAGNMSRNTKLEKLFYERGYIFKNGAFEQKYLDIARLQQQPLLGLGVHIHLTTRCNFRCPYCFQGRRKNCGGIMSEAVLESTFKAIACLREKNKISNENVWLKIFGGEPLLPCCRPLVFRILDYCKINNHPATITTNGYTLDAFMGKLTSYVDVIKFIHTTIDGPPKLHNVRRRLPSKSDTFSKIFHNVGMALDLGFSVLARTNLDEKNFAHLKELADLYIEQGWDSIKEFAIQLNCQFDMHKSLKARRGFFTAESYVRMKPVMRYIRERFINSPFANFWSPYIYNHFAPNFGIDLEYAEMTSFVSRTYYPVAPSCSADISQDISFMPDGKIYSCPVKAGTKDFSVGQVFPRIDIETINKRICSRSKVLKELPCEKCEALPMCGGGCPLLFYDNGNVVRNIKCHRMSDELKAFIFCYRNELANWFKFKRHE